MRTTVCILTLLGCAWAVPSNLKKTENFIQPLPTAQLGDVNAKVIGGEDAVPNSIPYQVALTTSRETICGGSLISPEWVLSAAHCTAGVSSVQVILGAHNLGLVEPTQVVVNSDSISNYPDYDFEKSYLNDITLIHLPYKVNLTDSIQVIGLAPANSDSFTGASALLSGWGLASDDATQASEVLQRVNLTVISNTECRITFGSLIEPSMLCTSGAGIVGVCSGDSGGPLVVGNLQVGVVSFGPGNCEGGLPSGFTRVSYAREWIESVTGF